MKRWLGLALAGLGLCLLLALGHPEVRRGMDRHPCLAGWGRSISLWREPALASPTPALAQNRGGRRGRAAAPDGLTVDGVLGIERGVGPPWLDTRGPPGSAAGTWVQLGAAGKTGSPRQGEVCISEPMHSDQLHVQDRGFCNSL